MPALRCTRFPLVACLALLLGGGVRADEKKTDKEAAVKEEWKRLNGTWEWVRAAADGKEAPAPKEKVTLTLKDGKATAKAGDKLLGEATAKVDPTTSPKSLDLTPAARGSKGKTVSAIYEVKGDTQRVCIAPPGKPRPKAFEAQEGSGHTLVTYKRVKARE
jgi:uncharacterized protein (TIGR03067 family)